MDATSDSPSLQRCLSESGITYYYIVSSAHLPTSRASMRKGGRPRWSLSPLPGDSVHCVPNGTFERHSDTFGRFKFGELIRSALGMQSLEIGIVLFCVAGWFLPCNWEFISQIHVNYQKNKQQPAACGQASSQHACQQPACGQQQYHAQVAVGL